MRVKLTSLGVHVPWKVDEIVTVQVVAVDDAGTYECETLETYPADLKDQHAKELAELSQRHATTIEQLTAEHASELDAVRRRSSRE